MTATKTISPTHTFTRIPEIGRICAHCGVLDPPHFAYEKRALTEPCKPRLGLGQPSGKVTSLEEEAFLIERFREPFRKLYDSDEYHDKSTGPAAYDMLEQLAQRFVISVGAPGVSYVSKPAARLEPGDIILKANQFLVVEKTGYMHEGSIGAIADYDVRCQGDDPNDPWGSAGGCWPISLKIVRKGPLPLELS